MADVVLMPKAGQTMEEGTVVSWLKKEGQSVEKGEPVVVIQTDKADLEVEATASGVLKAIFVPEGATVPVFSPIGVIAAPEEEVDLSQFAPAQAPGAEPAQAAAPAPQPTSEPARETPAKVRATPTAKKIARQRNIDLAAVTGTGPGGRILRQDVESTERQRLFASPVARKLAEEHGVDLRMLRGTGPEGRILKRDVEAALSKLPAAHAAPAEGQRRVVELTGMRKAIAAALQLSKQQAPHFYATRTVDMTAAVAYRTYLKETGRKVTINDLVLRAAVLALRDHPQVNCRVEGDRVTYFWQINLGVAVALEEGLVVPVIVDAGRYDLWELSHQSKRVTDAARQGKLIGTGTGTFTVTNLGMFGVENFCAIINPPEGAILAVGAVTDSLVVTDGGFAVRKIMQATVSADHRVIDGVEAARFLNSVKQYLETPELLGQEVASQAGQGG